MDELRAKYPDQYAEITDPKNKGKGPSLRHVMLYITLVFGGLIAQYFDEILNMFSSEQ